MTTAPPADQTTAPTRDNKRLLAMGGIVGLSLSVAFLVLNRWLVTDIGVMSYGRLWQLYTSYADLGFARRSLMGTLFSLSGAHALFQNEYVFAFAVHHLAVLALAAVLAAYVLARGVRDLVFVATVFLSPALVIQSAYTTGSLDIFLLVLIALNILFVRNTGVFCALLVAGLLVHELFLFTVPAQLFARWSSRAADTPSDPVRAWGLPLVVVGVTMVALALFGSADMSVSEIDAVMAQRIPRAVGGSELWSGSFELTSSTSDNLSHSLAILVSQLKIGAMYLVVPLAYVALVTARLAGMLDETRHRILAVGVVLVPLTAALVATDYYRWVGMSANMALLVSLVKAGEAGRARSRLDLPILLFFLVAPFGATSIERPFPMHQFVIEKLLR